MTASGFLIPFLLMTGVVTASAAEMRYTGADLRDPFVTLSQEKPVDEFLLVEQRLKSMNVEGLLLSPTNPRAIIGGKIYRIGSVLDVGKISRIDKEGVAVTVNGREVVIEQKIRKPIHETLKSNK